MGPVGTPTDGVGRRRWTPSAENRGLGTKHLEDVSTYKYYFRQISGLRTVHYLPNEVGRPVLGEPIQFNRTSQSFYLRRSGTRPGSLETGGGTLPSVRVPVVGSLKFSEGVAYRCT